MVDRLKIEQAEERHQLRKRIAELSAENERMKLEAAEWEAIARAKSEEALTHRREAEAMMSALSSHQRATSTVEAHETANVGGRLLTELVSVEEYAQGYDFRGDNGDYSPTDAERGMLVDFGHGLLGELEDAIKSKPPAPGDHQAVTKPEGQQEPVAWLTNLGWIDSPSYTVSFEGDKSGCDNFPVYTRPSEQAVTEELVAKVFHSFLKKWGFPIAEDFIRDVLKAAMEVGG